MPENEDIQRQIEELAGQISALEQDQLKFDDFIGRAASPPVVRSHLTRLVVWAFIAYAFGTGIYVVWCGDPAKVLSLMEIMKTMLLPLVTLMIGHYFGS